MARITTPGGIDKGNMELVIYGMTLSQIQQSTVLPTAATAIGMNTVILSAGDDLNALSKVFVGTIRTANFNGQAQPQVSGDNSSP